MLFAGVKILDALLTIITYYLEHFFFFYQSLTYEYIKTKIFRCDFYNDIAIRTKAGRLNRFSKLV